MRYFNVVRLMNIIWLTFMLLPAHTVLAESDGQSVKPFVVSGSILGLWPSIQLGLEAGYKFQPYDILLITHTKNTSFDSDVTTSYSAFKWQHFFNDSFYATFGSGIYSANWYKDHGGTADANRRWYASDSIAVSAGLGHRWTYESGFFIACNWFDFVLPILRIKGPRSEIQDRQLSLLTLKIGWEF